MQQLTLPFDGYAPIGQPETPGTAKQCKAQADSPLVRILTAVQQACTTRTKALYRQYKGSVPAVQTVRTARTALRYRIPFSLPHFLQAALCVASAFGLMFFAAIIGG